MSKGPLILFEILRFSYHFYFLILCLTIRLSVCHFISLSSCLSLYLSVHLTTCQSVCLSVLLSVCLSVSLSACQTPCRVVPDLKKDSTFSLKCIKKLPHVPKISVFPPPFEVWKMLNFFVCLLWEDTLSLGVLMQTFDIASMDFASTKLKAYGIQRLLLDQFTWINCSRSVGN